MRSRCLRVALLSWAIANPVQAQSESLTPQDFLSRYRAEVQKLISAYRQVQIEFAYSVTSVQTNQQRLYRRVWMHDGQSYKVIDNIESGPEKGEQDILVASPERSFILGKDSQGVFVKLLSAHKQDYEKLQRDAIDRSSITQAAYCMGTEPIIDFLSRKEVTITEVKSATVSGRSLMRVVFNALPFHEQMRQAKFKGAEGWFLFDPHDNWAAHGFELRNINSEGKFAFGQKETVEYGRPIDGIAVPSQVKIELVNAGGVYDVYQGDIKSVRFGPTDPAEFTPQGSGFVGHVDDVPEDRSRVFFWSLIVALVALLGVGFWLLRRRFAQSKSTA